MHILRSIWRHCFDWTLFKLWKIVEPISDIVIRDSLDRDALLCEFDRPDPTSLEQLRAVLAETPVGLPANRTLNRLRKDSPILAKGDLDSVFSVLKDHLEADAREQERFTTEVLAISFHYIVRRDDRDQRVVRIDTRLFRPSHPGGVSYGRQVVRAHENEYWLFAEPPEAGAGEA